MIKLTLDNVYIKIENIDQNTEMTIWNRLSFEIEEFGQQYNRVRHLYNRKTKKTYAGLLPNLIEILDELDEEYEIVDKRTKHEPNADFKLVDKITLPDGSEVNLQLRPYQKELVDKCEEREVAQCSTGGGKTIMMAALVAKYNVKPVGIFADKMSLCFQIKEEFEKFLGIPIGLVGGGINKKEDITVFSIQSTTPEDVKDMKMIMFDECVEYNTKVLMADGTYEKIGKLVDEKSNREIMSFNHKTEMIESKKIVNHSKTLLSDNNKKLMRITIKQEDGSLILIECTNNHKIWIESENKYIRADEIVRNNINYVRNSSNKIVDIYNIEYIEKEEEFVYDITVEDNHNFFANDILIHNCLNGNTLITLSDNSTKTIQEIVENKMECEVITYNIEKKIFENNKIYDWQKIPFECKNKKMVKLTIEDESGIEHIIECTEDHKVWIESENKYVEAGKLTKGMEVIVKGRN